MDYGVIFDCDGTLVDSMGAWHHALTVAVEQEGKEITPEDADKITGMSLPEANAFLHEVYNVGKDAADVEHIIFEYMQKFYTEEVVARPGALRFVEELYKAGVPMAVASSSSPHMLDACLTRCGFAPYMKAIVSVEDVNSSKRETKVYDYARSFLGTERANTWVFEDASYALETVMRAGYRSVGIYDNDISGTREQLQAIADVFIEGYIDFTAEDFLRINCGS